MNRILTFCKKQVVLSISFVLAVLSCFITPPSKRYLSYIDYRTILLLFSFMCVISGLRRLGIFDKMSNYLLTKVRNEKSVAIVLVLMSFFLAMFLTNDITLITLVPLTIIIFSSEATEMKREQKKLLVITLVIESLAANFGGMCMPFGSPQNMYLYSFFNMSMLHFFSTMLPFAIPGIIILIILVSFVNYDNSIEDHKMNNLPKPQSSTAGMHKLIIFLILFIISIAAVARLIDYLIATIIVLVITCILDIKALNKVNYVLLFTFIFFFIFIGNISNIHLLESVIRNSIHQHEVLASILTSQATSNVPAAILISKFTMNGTGILIGTNIGGMGTLIASMASLITYQLLGAKYPDAKGMFIKYFSIYNFILLIVFYCYYLIVH
ncbi:SLC13 family permease [Limosilactobacillus equigenerosi]|uniref:SLC13 family permease n=1 Tax=Limosilactobacillus equigenerosi TaxID=417373 RepID=UPI0009E68430|nr:SLC13 family permease [Limosilactobacillus equigenerosi]